MINIAITEDDINFIKQYKNMISRYMKSHGLECRIDDYSSPEDILAGSMNYDLFCLDIEMPGMNGLELADEIRIRCGNTPDIAFVTAKENAVYDVFRYNALGFVRKSVLERDFEEMMGRFLKKWKNRTKKYEFISNNGIFTKTAAEIIYAEVYGHKLQICCTDGTYQIRGTLNELAQKLEDEYFIQPYKGYLVNCRYIELVGQKELHLKAGDVKTIPISKHQIAEVRTRFLKYIKQE
ncbi:MAG: LytR/AlgR family response regulator transcription factor [Bacteroides sp.]